MNIDWEPFRQIVEAHQRFVLSSHVRPDADALGSELALAEMLEALGKTVRIVNPSSAPETLAFMDPAGRVAKLGEEGTAEALQNAEVHVVLDTSAWSQLADVGQTMRASSAKKVVVDHHVSADDLDAVEFKDTTAEATGALIFRLATDSGWPVTPTAAEALYCAIATDTGWFRFGSTTSETMRIVAALMDAGAAPHDLYSKLYEQVSLARLHLAGRVLSRVQVECDGRLAWTQVPKSDFKETGARPVDTEDLVNECLKIGGTQSAFIAVEQWNGQIKFSFRSRSDVSVARVAERFGGGGHSAAAGATLPGPMDEALARAREAMLDALKTPTAETV